MSPSAQPRQNATCLSSGGGSDSNIGALRLPQQGSARADGRRPVSADGTLRHVYDDSEDDSEDDEVGYADPVQDDVYARKLGLTTPPATNVPYDKFLPKFWTPEEDVHIQKIKLGSQRRPWYKKMQGFSSHIQVHTDPQPPKPQPPHFQTPPLVFARMDPTSGPRLVKCERRPLLGRQDPREPPDPIDYESIPPDLENDDMFARRTQAFQSNADLAMMKTRPSSSRPSGYLYSSSEPGLNIVTQPQRPGADRVGYPDIELDDVVYRRDNPQLAQQQRPLSGAPDNFSPMPIPEPWALPPDLQARLLCPPCPLTQEVAAPDAADRDEAQAHPRTDDMLLRKLGLGPARGQGSSRGPSANLLPPSVPTSCSEGDMQKWQAIREASRLRYKKRLMVERLAAMHS